MSEILRTRVIRPTTRQAASKSYKIDTSLVGLSDTLRVEIIHETKAGRWTYRFSGKDINGHKSISFHVTDPNGKVAISWGSLQPLNGSAKVSTPADAKPLAVLPQQGAEAVSSSRKTSFPPLITEGCTVLVLGTMPGEKSLALQQYYAHPRNRFWNVMANLIGGPAPSSYQERMNWLKRHKIALWDVAHQCERIGSLDSDIQGEEPNDIAGLLKKYPAIRCIAFNGNKAAAMYKRFFSQVPLIVYHTLPSTSPTNTVKADYIDSQWSALNTYMKGGCQ